MLTTERQLELSQLAEFISDKYFPGITIDPHVLADINNITYSYNNYGDAFDGLLEYDFNYQAFHIYSNLNRLISPASSRARFTFCHELAHYYIDEHRNTLMEGNSLFHGSKAEYESKLLVEEEADFFASNLLMPPTRFEKMAKKCNLGFDGIFKIKECFNSSITSTAVRYTSMNFVPCVLFKWSNVGQLQWKWQSKNFFQANFGYTFNKGDFNKLIKNSATEKVLNNKIESSEFFSETGTTVSTWFPKIKNAYFKNEILIEQCTSLGSYGALTILFPDGGKFQFI